MSRKPANANTKPANTNTNTKPAAPLTLRAILGTMLALNPATLKPAKPAALGLTTRAHNGNSNGAAWAHLAALLGSLGSSYARLESHKLSASKQLACLDLSSLSPDMAGITIYATCRAALLPLALAAQHAALSARAGNTQPWQSLVASPISAAAAILPPAQLDLTLPALVESLGNPL